MGSCDCALNGLGIYGEAREELVVSGDSIYCGEVNGT